MNDRFDVRENIILLSLLIVKRNLKRRQGVQDSSDVNFWSTSQAHMDVRKFQIDKFFDEVKDFFAGGRCPRDIRTLVKGIDNDVNVVLSWYAQHIFHTLCKSNASRLSCAASVL